MANKPKNMNFAIIIIQISKRYTDGYFVSTLAIAIDNITVFHLPIQTQIRMRMRKLPGETLYCHAKRKKKKRKRGTIAYLSILSTCVLLIN